MALTTFDTIIEKFGKQGEKTGWTYFVVPVDMAEMLSPGNRKSFRVKGFLDKHKISGIALIPMGEGNFIMPLKNDIRKLIKKGQGDSLHVRIEVDKEDYQLNTDLVECLKDEETASMNFYKLSRSHQNYYSKYVDAAKTEATKTKRIVLVVNAMHLNLSYAEMLRNAREISQ